MHRKISTIITPLHHALRGCIKILWIFILTSVFLSFGSIHAQAAHLSEIADSIDDLCTETKDQIPEKYSDSAIDALEEAISNIDKVNGHDLEQYECKASNFIEGAISKMNKYVNKLKRLVKRNKVSSETVDPLIKDAGDIVDALNHELPGGGAPASAVIGAELYAGNLCMLCHADDGSGGIVQVKIQGKENCDIYTAMMEEEVHGGITTTLGESNDLAAFLAEPGPLPLIATRPFEDPTSCRICHPRQYKEWQGTMMSYGARSPLFSALEAFGNELTGGALAKVDGVTDGSDLFCQRCHNPVDSFLDNFPTFADSNGQPLRDFASPVGSRGLSCDVCHQISGPDLTRNLIGDLGDGIANSAFILVPGTEKFGPFADSQPNPIHQSTNSDYIKSSEFCGACHDVRPRAADVVTGENFQRLEDLFTEWQNGPYGPITNTVGGVVSCQDCHMDVGPPAPAATYPEDKTTVFPRPRYAVERRVSTHYMTGVDIALIPFPGQDDPGTDSHDLPIGQKQRRDILLQSAATIELSAPPAVSPGAVLPITVDVTNVGAGHNIPSGFSQERQMWIELIVADADGGTIYQSGHLEDSAHPETEETPDGNLHDEDLQNLIVVVDPETGEATTLEHGPDYNQRHDDPPVNLGLANFGNEFIRVDPGTGAEEEVFIPFLANHMDNSHSIPPLETESVQYDVLIPAGTTGPISITARLRFRPFPPRFLRLLAQARPDLVDEALVDRNVIVEMTVASPRSVDITWYLDR